MSAYDPQAEAATSPPHSIDAERAILAVLLLSDRPMYALAIEEGLKAEHFFRPRHQLIWSAMRALYDDGEPITRIGLIEHLSSHGDLEAAGGADAIDDLAGPVPSAANIRQFARIVRDHARVRQLLAATCTIQAAVTEKQETVEGLMDLAEREILDAVAGNDPNVTRHIRDVLSEQTDHLHRLAERGGGITGTPSGWPSLDEITGGFQPGNLVILGARPSMGKSCAVTNIAEQVALAGGPVALFSLEMSQGELAQRFLASRARIKGYDLRHGRIPSDRWPDVMKASNELAAAPLYVDDTSDMNVAEIRAKARRIHQRHDGLALVIVDYLQLMRGNPRVDNRNQQVGEMSRGLKILARELNVPVIALSQLSRAVEQRMDKKPMLSDLRDSGNVEQDADVVIFLYRDEYYDRETERKGVADFIVAKHRNGPLGVAELSFLSQYPKFVEQPGGTAA